MQAARHDLGGDALPRASDFASFTPARYSAWVRSSRYLTMRDGVRIAIDLYLPARLGDEKLPTILRQTRYFRAMRPHPWLARALSEEQLDPTNAAIRTFFVKRGYAWVDVDVRGSGASFGTWASPWSPDEVRDGREVVDWILHQPWSNGRVGATGNSYDGTAAELLATLQHPAVRAIAPRCSLFDVYTDIAYPGGIPQRWFTRSWTKANMALDANRPAGLVAEVLGLGYPGLASGPLRRALEAVLGLSLRGVRPVDDDPHQETLARALSEHGANMDVDGAAQAVEFRDDVHLDSPLGQQTMELFSPAAYASLLRAADTAVFSISGWFDGGYPHAAIKRHLTLARPRDLLLLGPWNHGISLNASPYAKHRRASFHLAGELLRFFDHHLKGRTTGIESESPVRYFTMGAEQWQSASAWPPPDARPSRWYLREGGALSPDAPERARGEDVYTVDINVGSGLRSRWRTLVSPFVVPDYPDRRERGRLLLVYASQRLEHDLEVTGHVLVTLHLRADAEDGAVFVYLEEETSSGRVHYVTEGQLRLKHHALTNDGAPRLFQSPAPYRAFVRDAVRPLHGGESVPLVFDLLPTSYRFAKGSRLRLAIAAADVDHFGNVPGAARTYALLRDREHSSYIELPVRGL